MHPPMRSSQEIQAQLHSIEAHCEQVQQKYEKSVRTPPRREGLRLFYAISSVLIWMDYEKCAIYF